MKNITKRDFKAFLIGIVTMFLIILIIDWDDFKKGFNDGYSQKEPQSTIVKKIEST